jgi:hypothetical protein
MALGAFSSKAIVVVVIWQVIATDTFTRGALGDLSKTEMFNATSATLEGWLEEAIRACEGTGGLTGQNISRK